MRLRVQKRRMWCYFVRVGTHLYRCHGAVACDPNVAVDIPAGQWHSIHAVESGSVVLAVKNGRWESLSKEDILSL